MNKNQIHNTFIYTGIMLLDNDVLKTSPDYLKEKTLKFFNKLGKPEFIDFPKNNFWIKYLEIWNSKYDDFELLNIINFLKNVVPPYANINKRKVFSIFRKYIGDTNSISSNDLSFMCHPNILDFINKNIDFDDRFCKVHELREKLGY